MSNCGTCDSKGREYCPIHQSQTDITYDKFEKERKAIRENAKIHWEGWSWGNWCLHICPLDAECRYDGAPWRINFTTPKGTLYIALRPGDGVQIWLPFKGYLRKHSSPIAWHPRSKK